MSTTTHHRRESMFGLAHHPAQYSRFAGHLAGRLYRRVAADVGALGLPAGARVLDVGTGPGQRVGGVVDDHLAHHPAGAGRPGHEGAVGQREQLGDRQPHAVLQRGALARRHSWGGANCPSHAPARTAGPNTSVRHPGSA